MLTNTIFITMMCNPRIYYIFDIKLQLDDDGLNLQKFNLSIKIFNHISKISETCQFYGRSF